MITTTTAPPPTTRPTTPQTTAKITTTITTPTTTFVGCDSIEINLVSRKFHRKSDALYRSSQEAWEDIVPSQQRYPGTKLEINNWSIK